MSMYAQPSANMVLRFVRTCFGKRAIFPRGLQTLTVAALRFGSGVKIWGSDAGSWVLDVSSGSVGRLRPTVKAGCSLSTGCSILVSGCRPGVERGVAPPQST